MERETTPGLYLLRFSGDSHPKNLSLQDVQTGTTRHFDSLDALIRHLAELEALPRPPRAATPAN